MPQSGFGDKLRYLRSQMVPEPSLASIAAKVGVSQPTLTRYQANEQTPKIDVAQKIAGFFGMSYAQFSSFNVPEPGTEASNLPLPSSEDESFIVSIKLSKDPHSLEQAVQRVQAMYRTYFNITEAAA